jgi:hypothetical protein
MLRFVAVPVESYGVYSSLLWSLSPSSKILCATVYKKAGTRVPSLNTRIGRLLDGQGRQRLQAELAAAQLLLSDTHVLV